ncbi:MAG: alpha-amylase family glycosyl hydrolase [Thermomicrobiales bacterium]
MTTNVTQDFIFGTLATDDLRLEALRAEGRDLFHGNRIEPADPEPGQPVRIEVSVGTEVDAASIVVHYTTDGSDPSSESPVVSLAAAEVVWDTLLWGYRRIWRGELPAQPEGTLVHYRITAIDRAGTRIGIAATFAYHVDQGRLPDWVRDAVIYQIFVDRFRPGEGRDWNQAENFMEIWGGTLRGVIEALPYLESLGVNCLWLSPIFPSPTHHGYDATDYLTVEPRLGTTDDLVELFHEAHARGMRVLLDFVASHVSDQHPAFVRASTEADAPERDWFTFADWPDDYRSFFGVRSMPQVNTDDARARDYLIDAATHWLKLGADGFRLDYANGPSHAFWSAFRAATRDEKPDSFTVGEIVETAELQRTYQGRLDGTLDFLLLQQLRAFFAFDAIAAPDFDRFLSRHLAYFPHDFALPSFLDNHDMNRFLWIVEGDTRCLKLAALCQFTLPHPPIVYYGTEVGLSQRHDLEYPDSSRRAEESRTPMPWGDDQDQDLLGYYRDLIAVRRRHPSLWRGQRTTLVADEDGLYVVRIADADGVAMVALNRNSGERHVDLPPGYEPVVVTTDAVTFDADSAILPPFSGALLIGKHS